MPGPMRRIRPPPASPVSRSLASDPEGARLARSAAAPVMATARATARGRTRGSPRSVSRASQSLAQVPGGASRAKRAMGAGADTARVIVRATAARRSSAFRGSRSRARVPTGAPRSRSVTTAAPDTPHALAPSSTTPVPCRMARSSRALPSVQPRQSSSTSSRHPSSSRRTGTTCSGSMEMGACGEIPSRGAVLRSSRRGRSLTTASFPWMQRTSTSSRPAGR